MADRAPHLRVLFVGLVGWCAQQGLITAEQATHFSTRAHPLMSALRLISILLTRLGLKPEELRAMVQHAMDPEAYLAKWGRVMPVPDDAVEPGQTADQLLMLLDEALAQGGDPPAWFLRDVWPGILRQRVQGHGLNEYQLIAILVVLGELRCPQGK